MAFGTGIWKTQNSATLIASISSSFNPGQDGSLRHCLPVISQTNGSHAVDEECGEVEAPAVLTGRVVIGEGVVVVVESLAWNNSKESS
jgi:hypothetical protein